MLVQTDRTRQIRRALLYPYAAGPAATVTLGPCVVDLINLTLARLVGPHFFQRSAFRRSETKKKTFLIILFFSYSHPELDVSLTLRGVLTFFSTAAVL